MPSLCQVLPVKTEFCIDVVPFQGILDRDWQQRFDALSPYQEGIDTPTHAVEFMVHEISHQGVTGMFVRSDWVWAMARDPQIQEHFSLLSMHLMALVCWGDEVLVGQIKNRRQGMPGWLEFPPVVSIDPACVDQQRVDTHHALMHACVHRLHLDPEYVLLSHPLCLIYHPDLMQYSLAIQVWLDASVSLPSFHLGEYSSYEFVSRKNVRQVFDSYSPQVTPQSQALMDWVVTSKGW